MNYGDVPFVGAVAEAGPNDRVFDTMLLFGPVVLLLLAIVGRTTLTEGLAVLYLGTFLGYVLYNGVRRRRA